MRPVTVRVSDDLADAVVLPSGELDVADAEALREALLHASTAARRVVVDLGAVTFLDSSIIGVLVAARKRCAAEGVAFSVVNATGAPLKAIRLTGVDALLLC